MIEMDKLREICVKIGYREWELECWGCLWKRDLKYPWSVKWEDWKCATCWVEWKDIWLLRWHHNQILARWSIKEVIFSSEFIRYVYLYLHNNNKLNKQFLEWESFSEIMMQNLDDPVEFLYNLTIKKWKL